MSDKKNIDRLFQEKFKDFEVEPNEQVWINIDAALREKKKRRIISIWFKVSGIAAGLILGFFAFNALFDNTTSPENNQVVIGNEKQPDENSIKTPENESVVNIDNTTGKSDSKEKTINSSETNNTNNAVKEENNAIVNQNKSPKTTTLGSGISSGENDAVANTSKKSKSSPGKRMVKNSIHHPVEAVANNSSKTNRNKKNAANTSLISNTEENDAVANNLKSGKSKNDAQDRDPVLKSKENNTIAGGNNSDNTSPNTSKNNLLDKEKSNTSIAANQKSIDHQSNPKKNNLDVIDVPKAEAAKKDSTAIAVVEPNALEELLKKNEKEEEKIAEAKMNRWQITSNVAPIYFSSTSNGSPIDAQFAENSKSFENNLSFGVGVNYAVNKKISVRTGVNKFSLGYNTNDVVFFAAMDQVSFGNLTSSAAGSTIQVVSMSNTEALRPFDNGIQNTNAGTMTQRMGYFEVPVEMSYKLVDKKFGVNLIGGLSTLFLNENEVTVSSSTMSASLGKAKNLNDIHFSTNVGVGFRYRFWNSFEANFEPMFKYQINTFNKDAGNFKPYFIGLYSGVSFNF